MTTVPNLQYQLDQLKDQIARVVAAHSDRISGMWYRHDRMVKRVSVLDPRYPAWRDKCHRILMPLVARAHREHQTHIALLLHRRSLLKAELDRQQQILLLADFVLSNARPTPPAPSPAPEIIPPAPPAPLPALVWLSPPKPQPLTLIARKVGDSVYRATPNHITAHRPHTSNRPSVDDQIAAEMSRIKSDILNKFRQEKTHAY